MALNIASQSKSFWSYSHLAPSYLCAPQACLKPQKRQITATGKEQNMQGYVGGRISVAEIISQRAPVKQFRAKRVSFLGGWDF